MQNFNTHLPVGTTVKDRYLVEEILGKGEFGTSYLVRDKRENQRLFVLKELINPAGKGRNRIPSEVVALMRLNHPALPRVHQVLNDDIHDQSYLLMDYIDGTSLEALQSEQPEQRFSLSQVMTLMAPIMNVLMYLHNQQPPIIHQHIKPSSIIISNTGTGTMLISFGFSRRYDTMRYDSRGYTAPEQYSATSSVSPRTDIYALGAVFYTLLTGTVPRAAHNRLIQLENKQPVSLIPANQLVPAIPTALADVIHRAMSISRNDRFSSVEQLWEALWQAVIISPMVEQPHESMFVVPDEGSREEDTNPTIQQITEPAVTTPDVEVPELFANPIGKQAADPVIALSEPPQTPFFSEETATPVPTPFTPIPAFLAEQPQTHRFKTPRRLSLISLILIVTLLISIVLGASLWIYAAGHYGLNSALPTSIAQFKETPSLHATASPNSKITATPAFVSTSYPNIAKPYIGTILDIPGNVTTNMALSALQQQQGRIRGHFTGLNRNGSFQGTIDTAKHIQFIVTGNVGQATLTFDGNLLLDGQIAGTYCGPNQAGKCTDYGIWSVSPASS